MSKSVNCPTCLKPVAWIDSNTFRPFCSERCKLIDLGDWASGKNAIAGEPLNNEDAEGSATDNEDLLQY
jgi:endogenous inhibitor of DNA gyrase (YacG/DUF329 family)